MNTIKYTMSFAFLAVVLAACGEKTKTEEWYINHPEELKKEVAKCKAKSLPELLKDQHCQDIEKARIKAFNEQQRNAPIPKFDINKFK